MAEIREITSGLEFPEGPIAMDDGSVILTEIKRGTLTRVKPDGTKEIVAETGGGAERRGNPGRTAKSMYVITVALNGWTPAD